MRRFWVMLRFFIPVVLWSLVIFTFSSFPTGSASRYYWPDFVVKKLAHMVEYGILALLVYRAFINTGVSKPVSLRFAFVWAVVYGMTDEVHQSFTPGREATLRDVIFDTIGAGVALYFLWKLLPKMPLRLRRLAEDFQLA